jgi:NAD(P)-dependent dehydrogenase (short-subunit alcohol dehydrogenase family)
MSDGTAPLLEGRAVVVSGSSRGIGRAVAAALAAEGAAVVVNGRDAAVVEAAAAELRADGARVAAVVGSAADEGVAAQLVAAAVDGFGRLDAVVNCAGTAEPPGSSILSVSHDEWRQLLDAHVTSAFAVCRAAAPALVAQGHGSIVNTSSFAFTGMFGGTGYPAGKGAVNSLTMALAAELAEHGVRANVVCPGARTRLSTGDGFERSILELHRRGLLDDGMRDAALAPAPPEYVAQLYVFLVSDLAAGVSGEVLAGAGCFIGRYARPEPAFVAWRDHGSNPPWTPAEIGEALRDAVP